jgi:hypothetical protein
MSSVSSSFATVPRRQYVASGVFTNNFFSYKTSLDRSLNTRGTLAVLSGATDLKCAAGHILRETGKKLQKGTHPDLLDPTTQTQYHTLVGVYDIISGLNGFIDPNSPLFAPFNTDKSYQHNLGAEALDSSGLQEEGPPVYTTGNITTTTGVITSTKVNVSPVSSTTGTSGTPLTTSFGKASLTANTATVYTTACTANSMVLVTVNNVTPQKVSVVPSVGSFVVYTDAGATSLFNWMIIN